MKIFKKSIICIFILLLILMGLCIPSKAANSYLNLNELNFYAKINDDGSMDVVETWNIEIEDTNTLFKTFELDNTKFSSIDNVKVKDVTANKEFNQIDEEMYHVTKDCYYGLVNSNGAFEIAWGVGLDDEEDTRTYEISYTVEDAVSKYNDYAELYWQFIGEDFEIDADKITGTIELPESANSTEDIKVWGHTEGLNGEIYATATNEITFELNNFYAGRFVEVRTLFPSYMIENTNRTYSTNRYEEVVQEETEWVNEANARRRQEEIKDLIITILMIIAIIIITVILIVKAVKYGKKLKTLNKYKPEQELEYFRDLPSKDVTPGEATYILQEAYYGFSSSFGRIFSATMLDLKLKDYIDLRVEKDKKDKDVIYIKRIKPSDEKLKNDEKKVLDFIYKVEKKKEEITIKQLEKYITSHSSSVQKLIEQSGKDIEDQLVLEGILNKSNKEEYIKYQTMSGLYFVFAIIVLMFAFPVSIALIVNGILCFKIKKRINVLTQKGIDSKEKWKGLKKYMEDFSLLNEKEVPAIEVWEKYLVYATAFGIADKVLEQLKTVYPNIDQMDVSASAYMYFMYHSNFSTSFNSAISSSISSSYSSATGGGGGFSGGGGGGRWPEVAAAGR